MGKYVKKDRLGARHGYLTIVADSGRKNSKRETLWTVKCDCGALRYRTYTGFLRQNSCSCRKTLRGKESGSWRGVGDLSGYYWCCLRKGAEIRKIPFIISKEYAWALFLKQDARCQLSGIPLTMRSNDKEGNASIDRINNDEGYLEGNIQWVDKYVNQAKNRHSLTKFLDMCRNVAKMNPL